MEKPVLSLLLCFLAMMNHIVSTLGQSTCTSPTTDVTVCDCEVRDTKKIINCRYKNLVALPSFLASSTIYDEITFSSTEAGGCPLCNNFTSIPENAFVNLKVKKIDLTRVPITDFNINSFYGLENVLEELLIEGTGANAPPYTVIDTLGKLRRLHLENFLQPQMTQSNIFGKLPELESLTLNKIVSLTQIESSTFEITGPPRISKVPKLSELHLQIIDFSSLPVAPILTLSELTTLEVMDTKITTIYGYSFQSLNKLKNLEITRNLLLATIEPTAFFGIMDTLEHLQLENNALTSQIQQPLQNGNWDNLMQLNIGLNNIGTIPASMFSKMPSLQYLSLHEVHLATVDSTMFTGLTKLHALDLSYNYITNIANGAFTNNPDLNEIQLQNQQSGATMQLGVNVFQNVETSIEHLDLSYSKCDLLQLWTAISTLSKLQRLTVAGLGIAAIPEYTFHRNIQLSFIDLTENNITAVQQETFYGPRESLQTIVLNNNQLQSVSKCVLHDFTAMPELTLAGNPLICDCRLLWLYDWIHAQPNTASAGYNNGVCFSPGNLAGQYLFQVNRTDLVCPAPVNPACKDLYTTTVKTTTTTTTTITQPTTTTEEEIEMPTLHFYIGQKTDKSISVGWDVNPKTFVTSYVLTIENTPTSYKEERTLNPGRTEDTFIQLQPDTTYTFCFSIILNNKLQPTKTCDFAKTLPSTESSTVPTTPEPASSIETGIIIGAAAGGVVFVALIITIVILLLKYRKPKKRLPATEGVKFTARTSDIPSEGGTARRFAKKPDPNKGASPDDIQVTVISNGNMENKDRFSAGSYQFLNKNDPKGVHKNPMPSTSGGAYVNSLDNRPLPSAPGGGTPKGAPKGRGYVNTGYKGGASNMPETSINQYSEVKI